MGDACARYEFGSACVRLGGLAPRANVTVSGRWRKRAPSHSPHSPDPYCLIWDGNLGFCPVGPTSLENQKALTS